jgi:hypothetical protein
MKNKIYCTIIIGMTALSGIVKADPVTINQVGVGARAFSMANNYVALSNDLSGIFWNPAALSFLPVREFQGGIDILDNRNNADFNGTRERSDVRRIRLSSLGFLSAIPASRGGLTFAGAVQSPYIFEDNPTFSGMYRKGDKTISLDQQFKGYGSLTYLSGAFGVQVAPGFGVGATASLVLGSERIHKIFSRYTDGQFNDPINDDYDQTIDRGNVGYDFRIGLFYSPVESLRFGMRITLPQTIWFNEDYFEYYPGTDSLPYGDSFTGKLLSSYSGALGFALKLPYVTVSSEVRARAPYDMVYADENIPTSSPAAHARVGFGAGAEVPLFSTKWVARAGYSWDEYDPFQFVRKYTPKYSDEKDAIDWNTGAMSAKKARNLLSAGLAYVENRWSVEGAYGYQTWELNTQVDQGALLEENYALQRFTLSLSIHY